MNGVGVGVYWRCRRPPASRPNSRPAVPHGLHHSFQDLMGLLRRLVAEHWIFQVHSMTWTVVSAPKVARFKIIWGAHQQSFPFAGDSSVRADDAGRLNSDFTLPAKLSPVALAALSASRRFMAGALTRGGTTLECELLRHFWAQVSGSANDCLFTQTLSVQMYGYESRVTA